MSVGIQAIATAFVFYLDHADSQPRPEFLDIYMFALGVAGVTSALIYGITSALLR